MMDGFVHGHGGGDGNCSVLYLMKGIHSIEATNRCDSSD